MSAISGIVPHADRICSPRWLFSVGKEEQARAVLAKLHSSTGDIHSPLIDLEMEEIAEKVVVDGPDSTFQPASYTVQTPKVHHLYRAMVGLPTAFQDSPRPLSHRDDPPHWNFWSVIR